MASKRRHRYPPLNSEPTVTFDELARRWGITSNGAILRIEKRQIEIVRDHRGRRAVREADLVGVDFESRPPREIAAPTRAIAVRPPEATFDAVQVGDSGRIERLLLALKTISGLAHGDDRAISKAIESLASYVVAAESPHGG
jgi:hypothetical protein